MRTTSRLTRRFLVEQMEPRCLLAANPAITEFAVPTAGSKPSEITTGPDGNLWFTESNANQIGRINPTTGVITEFPLPDSGYPVGITVGPDGNLWFAVYGTNKIGRIDPTTGVVTEFPLPDYAGPLGITLGPDGNLWFTEFANSSIGRITPGGTITEFSVPTANSDPYGITAGADGNLWFTDLGAGMIGTINPTTDAITEFAIPTNQSEPEGITAGPDGNLWFTEYNSGQIGKFDPTTDTITEFPIPTRLGTPAEITVGPDGDLWFTEFIGDQIGRINPTTDVLTEFPSPTVGTYPLGITSGPDGNLWFTESGTAKIDRLDPPLNAAGTTISATEGAPVTATVATFTDGDLSSSPGDFTATIDWGDGTTTAGQVLEDASKTFYVTGTHTFTDDGPRFAVSATIADKDGSTTTAASTAIYVPTPVAPVADVVSATEGQAVPSSTVVASFTGSGPAGQYNATINWGDGHTDPASVTGGGGVFQVVTTAAHTYTEEGNDPITVTIQEKNLLGQVVETATTLDPVVAADAKLTASATQPAVSASKAALFSGAVASFTDANPWATAADFMATIDWGDGAPQSAGTVSLSGGVFTVNGQHVYAQERTYPITVTIHDAGGSVLTTATGATIADVAPLVSGIPVSMTKKNQFTTPVAYIVEPVGALAEPANQFTATINWGDGTTSSGTVEAVPGGDWVVGTHTYAGSGPYTVTVNVTASDGFKVSTMTTANDPPRVPGGPWHHRHFRPAHGGHHTALRRGHHTRQRDGG